METAAAYHGKIINFDDDDLEQFREQLPRRADFVKDNIHTTVEKGRPIMFLPNCVYDVHYDANKLDDHSINGKVFALLMFGVLRDGNKAAVIVKGIYPFVDVRVPEGANADEFKSWVGRNMKDLRPSKRDSAIKCCGTEIIMARPFKYFNEGKSPYIRIYFPTTWARNAAISYFRDYAIRDIDVATDYRVRYETANDDGGGYYRKASREYGFKLCDWNGVSKYKRVMTNDFVRRESVPYTFIVDVSNFKSAKDVGIDIQSDPIKYRCFLRDKSMEMDWDLETSSEFPSGNPPLPENVFKTVVGPDGKEKKVEQDKIFMDACAFSWYLERDPFLVINFTDMPVPARPDCMIVICRNQIQIIKAKAILVGRMAPEFVVAFNDGLYDWPFIIRRIEGYDSLKPGTPIMDFVKSEMSMVQMPPQKNGRTDPNSRIIHGPREKPVKLEAGVNSSKFFFDVPGFVCVDTRTVFQQLYPTSEQSSLNYFLKINNLGSKEDMPYNTMFIVHNVLRILDLHYKACGDYELILAALHEITDPDERIFRDIGKNGSPEVRELLRTDAFKVRGLSVREIIDLVCRATEVVHYCNVDARRCHDLLRVCNVIADRREIANISFTSIFDALYYAGGMKVRNLCISEAIKSKWGLAPSNIGGGFKDDRKYPGGYVMYPKKGLYRDHISIKESRCGPRTTDRENNNDINFTSDRPCVGLDFSSLYPSLIMTYNISPEKIITDHTLVEYLTGRLDEWGHPYRFSHIQFTYGYKDQAESEKEIVEGWVVQHTPVEITDENGKKTVRYDGMGVYPTVLKALYDLRSEIKRKMEYYTGPKEFLDGVIKNYSAALPGMSEDDQKTLLREALEELRAKAVQNYEANPVPFLRGKIKATEEVAHFFEKEWFNRATQQNTCVESTIPELFEEIVFFFKYFNTKQLGLKVFMNTFYGESGNTISSFFIKHVAGKITTSGQENIKMVKRFVEERGCRVLYSDTDSLYISPPDTVFAKADADYEAGKCTKREYWTSMIETTMEYLDGLKLEVNNMLYRDNGTRFLKMDYEECLWPFCLLGKKKYVGIQHQGIVNLQACMPDISLENFISAKSLFIRGIEVKKRGSSGFLKQTTYEILKEAFSINSTATFREIVEGKLSQLATMKTEPSLFEKTARYRLPGKKEDGSPKPGNKAVLKFVARMYDIETTRPDIGIKAPEVGERFNYIIAKKSISYDLRGCIKRPSTSDKYEYLSSIGLTAYEDIRGEPIVVDIDYYITNEIIGQFARFLTYHPEYNKFYDDLIRSATDDVDLEEKYKLADKKARDFAQKQLRAAYKEQMPKQTTVGREKKSQFRQLNKRVHAKMLERCGNEAAVILSIVDKVATNYPARRTAHGVEYKDSSEVRFKMSNELFAAARKKGEALARHGIIEAIMKALGKSIFQIAPVYVSAPTMRDRTLLEKRALAAEARMNKLQAELGGVLPEFEKICANNTKFLSDILLYASLDPNDEDAFELAFPEMGAKSLEALDRVYGIWRSLIAEHKMRAECKIMYDEITYLRSIGVKDNPRPPGVKLVRTKGAYRAWQGSRGQK